MRSRIRCVQCNKEALFLSGCCFCGEAFCAEHVRPENHRCLKMYEVLKSWHQREIVTQKTRKSRRFLCSTFVLCMTMILLTTVLPYDSYHSVSRGLKDPTYKQALQFIESDKTDRNVYVYGKYVCADFATDFRSNALKVGYKCGYVLVFLADCTHALNCFNTTDCGLIFVEPQEDEIVTLTIGRAYWSGTRIGSYNDTVLSFLITWWNFTCTHMPNSWIRS